MLENLFLDSSEFPVPAIGPTGRPFGPLISTSGRAEMASAGVQAMQQPPRSRSPKRDRTGAFVPPRTICVVRSVSPVDKDELSDGGDNPTMRGTDSLGNIARWDETDGDEVDVNRPFATLYIDTQQHSASQYLKQNLKCPKAPREIVLQPPERSNGPLLIPSAPPSYNDESPRFPKRGEGKGSSSQYVPPPPPPDVSPRMPNRSPDAYGSTGEKLSSKGSSNRISSRKKQLSTYTPPRPPQALSGRREIDLTEGSDEVLMDDGDKSDSEDSLNIVVPGSHHTPPPPPPSARTPPAERSAMSRQESERSNLSPRKPRRSLSPSSTGLKLSGNLSRDRLQKVASRASINTAPTVLNPTGMDRRSGLVKEQAFGGRRGGGLQRTTSSMLSTQSLHGGGGRRPARRAIPSRSDTNSQQMLSSLARHASEQTLNSIHTAPQQQARQVSLSSHSTHRPGVQRKISGYIPTHSLRGTQDTEANRHGPRLPRRQASGLLERMPSETTNSEESFA